MTKPTKKADRTTENEMEAYLNSMGLTDEALDRGKATANAVAFTFSGSV